MSPEYAMHGIFSAKSDVFSFGVILLEIITGKKNREAWSLWRESRSLELVDAAMDSAFPETEVLRCMKMGLLCVQEHSEDRPIMDSVVKMLGNSNMALPQPKRVGFCPRDGTVPQDESSPFIQGSTLHALTVTLFEGR
ncbi:Receptor-like serine/threonine-protein kinase SD1-6 [Platanthera guangdongensis]|uniref:Receptor-like serine/threonine-protein kinase SD1-6 n=1 Tax=Platanthera guangdongensis TaxID=2320717 RepID=A0ABR2MWJ6_9ASPA